MIGMLKKDLRIILFPLSLLGIVLFGMIGCSTGSHLERDYISDSPSPQRQMSVLVIPFRNLTVHPNAGLALARLMATELRKEGVFDVRESPRLESGSDGPIPDEPVAMARAAGVDAVLLGFVTEYGYRYGFRKQPVVGIDLRLIRTDGTVLWAASASEAGSAYLGRDSVTEAAQRMVMRLVQRLSEQMMTEGEQ